MSDRFATTTVADIVAADFRTAAVFEQFGIDFCCNGRNLLADACRTTGADIDAVVHAIDLLPEQTADAAADDVARRSIPELVDHIESTHHAYVRSAMPAIAKHLAALIEAHGSRHPELRRVAACFQELSDELSQHLVKEERVLFPYVRELAAAGHASGWHSPFGTVENPIRMMEREHSEAGSELRLMRELTGGYVPPPDGCTTYALTMTELQAFERDLHRHIHLENNVLFPAAVRLERELTGTAEG